MPDLTPEQRAEQIVTQWITAGILLPEPHLRCLERLIVTQFRAVEAETWEEAAEYGASRSRYYGQVVGDGFTDGKVNMALEFMAECRRRATRGTP